MIWCRWQPLNPLKHSCQTCITEIICHCQLLNQRQNSCQNLYYKGILCRCQPVNQWQHSLSKPVLLNCTMGPMNLDIREYDVSFYRMAAQLSKSILPGWYDVVVSLLVNGLSPLSLANGSRAFKVHITRVICCCCQPFSKWVVPFVISEWQQSFQSPYYQGDMLLLSAF